MIFVTVGTHEQGFNRLLRHVDELKAQGRIEEEIVFQTGYSTYEPKHGRWERFFGYDEMNALMEDSHIVITHGGPASFLMAVQKGRLPIVVPRQFKFDEHVNDHQLEFVLELERRQKSILCVVDIEDLYDKIQNYDTLVETIGRNQESNNASFCNQLRSHIESLF